jgi:hypothetical protein
MMRFWEKFKNVIHYELQHYGFVHAHIILWVHEYDLERITNEIVFFFLQYLMKYLQNLPPQMIVYNLNYLKLFYKNNCMNIKIDVFEKS